MIVNDHLDEAADKTKEKIQWLLHFQRNPNTSESQHALLRRRKDKFLAHCKAARDDSDLVVWFQQNRRTYEGSIIINVRSGLNGIEI